MHRSIASAASAVVLAAALVACGGSDGDNAKASPTKGTGSSSSAQPGGGQTQEPPASTPDSAGLGDTLSLEGRPGLGSSSTGTVTADITLDQYEDHAQPKFQSFEAGPGKRLVAAKFTIVSTGDSTYGDTGNMGAKVVDSTGSVYAAKPGIPTVGDSLDLVLSLRPGEEVTGWVIFDVPQSAKITAVEYEMNAAGLGLDLDERAGKWTLG
ncbi:DUF4352 domain-containing protein [Streptomyces sp. NPDC020983]|uniref:DUF4352 domain-containing protein n=1 Tax=Streptomyces sp. NPDC020983 TaxID=3365106 RepID=UPI0037A460B9